jgi:hypothetical protein
VAHYFEQGAWFEERKPDFTVCLPVAKALSEDVEVLP